MVAEDVAGVSVAAYEPHVGGYAGAHAHRMCDAVARFLRAVPPGAAVLDAGCGPGRDLRRFAAAGRRPVGVDLSAAMLLAAADAAPVARGDLLALPFQHAAFSAVWACASLVHLPEPAAVTALRELARVAAPGAPVYVSVKALGGPGGWRDTRHGRRWFQTWAADRFAAAVAAAGFRVSAAAVDNDFVDVWAHRR